MRKEDVSTSSIERMTRRVPSAGFLGLAFGSIALSASLMLMGRKNWANFVGQWAPTFLILGTYIRMAKSISAPYGEEQRVQQGAGAPILKGQEEVSRQPRPLI